MRLFRNLSLLQRYIGVWIFVCLAFISLIVLHYSLGKRQEELVKVGIEAINIKTLIAGYNGLISELDQLPIDDYKFYVKGENNLTIAIRSLQDSVSDAVTKIGLNPIFDAPELVMTENEINETFDRYSIQTLRYIELIKQKGNSNSGLIGESVRLGNLLFNLGQNFSGDQQFGFDFLRYLHYDKLYLATRDKSYAEELEVYKSSLQSKLNSNTSVPNLTVSDQKILIGILDQNFLVTKKLTNLDSELDSNRLNSLFSILLKDRTELNKLTEQLTAKINDEIESGFMLQMAVFNMLGLALLLLTMGALAILLMSLKTNYNRIISLFDSIKVGEVLQDHPDAYPAELKKIYRLGIQIIEESSEFISISRALSSGETPEIIAKTKDQEVLVDLMRYIEKIKADAIKSRKEEQFNSWQMQGQSKIEAIFRTTDPDLKSLSNRLLKTLIDFLGVNQGALFLQDESKNELELFATYSFGKIKEQQGKQRTGESLVGTCALERKSIFLTEVPADYFHITSGLGGSSPSSIFIIPLQVENELYGVLEVDSFEIISVEFRIFLESVANNIAAGFSRIRSNYQASVLSEITALKSAEIAANEDKFKVLMQTQEREIKDLHMQLKEQITKNIQLTTMLNHSQKTEELLRLEVLKFQHFNNSNTENTDHESAE